MKLTSTPLLPPVLLALSTLTTAAPTTNSTLESRAAKISGSINFHKRWDCKNTCVERGLCLSGQADKGMKSSSPDWVGWDAGCWDLPTDANSIALKVNNGHKFLALDKSCKEFKDSGFNAKTEELAVGKKDLECNPREEGWKAVSYVW